jgi:hypothetical protein
MAAMDGGYQHAPAPIRGPHKYARKRSPHGYEIGLCSTAYYGRDIIAYGSTDRSRASKMRRENLSPHYATCWDEPLVAR